MAAAAGLKATVGSSAAELGTLKAAGLIQRYREALQARHYARHTVTSCEQWLRRFLRFHNRRHPREMGSSEVNAFLSHLAVELQVSPSTQNQALAALLFRYQELLERDLELDGIVRGRSKRCLPLVLTPEEVKAVLDRLDGENALVAGLLYGSGLRLLTMHNGKGGKDRRTLLPERLIKPPTGDGSGWSPSSTGWRHPSTAQQGRHHLDPSLIQKAVRQAMLGAGLSKPATCHTLRHSLASHLLQRGPMGVASPADLL